LASTTSSSRRFAVPRLASIDAYRGLVMLLMMAEVLRFCSVATMLPGSRLWAFLCRQQSHVEWSGASLHDLIMPSFAVLIGVALSFSIRSRLARGQSARGILKHAALRAIVLIVLGLMIASAHPHRWVWAFEDILPQAGLGYIPLAALALRPSRDLWAALVSILFGYWLAFALYPVPGQDFDYRSVGVSADWLGAYGLSGFAAHWQKNSNLGWRVDTWFLNLFPRDQPFVYNPEGYATLSFIPMLGTMLIGLIAGRVIQSVPSVVLRVSQLGIAGAIAIGLGWLGEYSGVCPIVKRLWTPSWTLWSGGVAVVALAAAHVLIDLCKGGARLSFPLIVIGINPITAYCLAHFYSAFAFNSVRRVIHPEMFRVLGAPYEPVLYGVTILAGYWLLLFAMYWRRLLLRI
jgi:predicted acyltransferase